MYFEEFSVGQKFELEPIPFTAEEIESFARRYDPQPIHIDPEFSARGMFGKCIASGFHTVSAVWGAWIRNNRFGKEIIVGTGMDYITWTAPVYAEDTLHTQVEVTETVPSSLQKRGLVALKFTATNQDGRTVLHMQGRAYLRKQPESNND